MKWEKKTLDELGTVGRGRSKHRPRNDPKLFGGKYPFIQTADVKNANFYIINFSSTYNEEGLAQSKLWPAGTLCITIAANIADTGILAIPACFPDSIMGFVANEEIADTRFVKYCFDVLQKECKQISQGTAQDNLSWEKLSTINFLVPPLQTQKRIASILSAYDDLIENNQKQIKLLEEAAQRLYKEWFVDLRFPGHESVKIVDGVPEGWSRKYIGDIVSYDIGGGWGEDCITGKCEKAAFVIRGTDIYGITHGEISSIPYRYHSETNLKSRQLVDGDIVFEVSGGSKTEGVAKTVLIKSPLLSVFNASIMCASFCKLVRLENVKLSQFMYDTFQYLRLSGKTSAFDKKSASSIVNYRWKDFLAQQEILCPDLKILEKYNELAERCYITIVNHSILVEKLREARDRLLPKLMSGEIEV